MLLQIKTIWFAAKNAKPSLQSSVFSLLPKERGRNNFLNYASQLQATLPDLKSQKHQNSLLFLQLL
jgi:hypothetical protein